MKKPQQKNKRHYYSEIIYKGNMNIKFLIISSLLISISVMFSGCGVKQKKLLNKLFVGMPKIKVESTMGKPDAINGPTTNSKGDVIDIWEYRLATVDEKQERKVNAAILAFDLATIPLIFIPELSRAVRITLACVPWRIIPLCFMDSPYSFDTYCLKFVNNLLSQWGRKNDLDSVMQPGSMVKS